MKHQAKFINFYNQSYFYPHQRFPPVEIQIAMKVMEAVSQSKRREIEHWGTCRPSLLASLGYGAGNKAKVVAIQVFDDCYVADSETLGILAEDCPDNEPPWSLGLPDNVGVGAYHEFDPRSVFVSRSETLIVLDARPQTMAGLSQTLRLDNLLFRDPDRIYTDFLVLSDLDKRLGSYAAEVLPHHSEERLADSLSLFTRHKDKTLQDENIV